MVAACWWVLWDSILLVAVEARWEVDRRYGLATRVVILMVAVLRRSIVGC